MTLWSQFKKYWDIGQFVPKLAANSATPRLTPSQRQHKKYSSVAIACLSIVSLTSVIGDRFYNQPQLAVGTIAPRTVIAPNNGEFEDPKTTEEKRQEIRRGAILSLKRDPEMTAQIKQDIRTMLDEVAQIRSISGGFPFLDPLVLSTPSQMSLRQLNDEQWQQFMAIADQLTLTERPTLGQLIPQDIELVTPIRELYNYATTNPDDVQKTITEIMVAREGYQQAVQAAEEKDTPLFNRHQNLIFRLSDEQWTATQKYITKSSDRILIQGIPQGVAPTLLNETIQVQVDNDTLASLLVVDVLSEKLRPNLIEDKDETKRRSEQAALAVDPVMVSISEGEAIVNKGETITQSDFVLLDGFKLSDRQINWLGLGSYALMVSTSVGVMVFMIRRVHRPMRCRDHLLLYLISLSTPLLVFFEVPYGNLAAVGLLTSSLYNPAIAVTQVSLLSGLVAISSEAIKWESLIAGTVGGLIASVMGGRLRSREEQATMGGIVGISQTIVSLSVSLIASASAGTVWYVLLPEAAFYGFSGTAWIVLALGISPYLERFFDLVTPIRLAELSNPNRPLLKRLALEAPGTFQHTMFVASLAEAAARDLHCNVELVRAGTLYHDIGKMHDPLGFIENQMGGPNKHDAINNPWKSKEIIRKHVTEGLVMAKKYGLPKAIRDFIPEHQGRLLISYFHYQAKQNAEKEGKSPDDIDEEAFRYAGPIPQSRETGLVMLADGCEAALRSLKEATPEQAIVMVNKIFRARWQDGQLDDCGIRREELTYIAELFVQVWQQHNHQRLAYPKGALETKRV
ncbi:MAG: HDIG domain-containing metalloprotein [Limnothrix sp.]